MFGLKNIQISAINSVFEQYKTIDRVVLYGSRAKGNYKNGSDIDLTILEQGMSYRDVLRIESLLDDLLLPYKIDLSLYRHIKHPDLIKHIEKSGKIFYHKKKDPIHAEIGL